MANRKLPQDEEIEKAALGSCFQGGADDLFARSPVDMWFHTLAHAMIFRQIAALHDAGLPIEPVTVCGRLEAAGDLEAAGGRAFVNSLPECSPSSTSVDYYCDALVELYRKRRIIVMGEKLIEEGFSGKPAAELVEEAGGIVSELSNISSGETVDIRSAIRGVVDDLEKSAATPGALRGLSTGFFGLDRIARGMKPGQLILLGGRTSSGKTALALNIAERLAVGQQVPTLVFSLEMAAKELVMRLLCSEAGVDSERAELGELTEGDAQRLAVASAKLAASRLSIVERSRIGVSYIRAVARNHSQRRGLGAVVVDYLQLLAGRGRFENRVAEISQISRELKQLAREQGVPILALAQLSREHIKHDRAPDLADLRESGSLEQDADMVWLIERKPDSSGAKLHVRKNRSGRCGTVDLSFDAATTRFTDLRPSE